MGKVLGLVFVGVFVGALGYEILKKTGAAEQIARTVAKGVESAKQILAGDYQTIADDKPAKA